MELSGFWTRPISILDINLKKIYPYIISVDIASYITKGEKRNAPLLPSEFREGPVVSIRNINSNFFIEFTDYLWANSLENTLGLKTI